MLARRLTLLVCALLIYSCQNNAASLYNKGVEFLDKQQYDSTVVYITKALQVGSEDSLFEISAYYWRGLAYSYLKKYENAILDYSEVLVRDSTYAYIFELRGIAYVNREQYELAMQDFTKAIELEPDSAADSYLWRGIAYENTGLKDKAIKDYSNAIKCDLNCFTAHNRRGLLYYYDKRDSLAIIDFTYIIENSIPDAKDYDNRGAAYLGNKQYQLAIEDWKKAHELNSKYPSLPGAKKLIGVVE